MLMIKVTADPRLVIHALFLVFVGFLALPLQSRAEERSNLPPPLAQYGMETWDGADGLPQIRIRAIVQTPDSYLWLGTANGLVRFDGVNFRTYDTSTGSLKDNEITSMVEGDDGALWIGTSNDGGLTRLNNGQFTTFTTTDGLPNNSIRILDKDRLGNIWFATPSGVGCYSDGRFTTFTTREGLPDDFVSSICASSSQGVFAISGGKLNRLVNGRFMTEYGAIDSSDGRLDSMACGPDGALWMTFETSKVKRWINGEVTTYTAAAGRPFDRPSRIYRDPQGDMWITARDGLLRFSHGTFEALRTSEAQAKLGLVDSLAADREGDLWVGTDANGLVRLRPVAVYTLTAADGLSDTSTRCVFRDRDGNIWVGAYMGFARISHGTVTPFRQMDGQPIPTVTSIAQDGQGRILIAAGGVLYFFENDRLNPVPGWKKVFDVKAMAQDWRGDIWIGTDGAGLARFSDGKFIAFRTADGLAGNQVRSILCDEHGVVWIGTTTGLSRYQDGKFTTFTVREGLPNGRVMSLCEEADGALWIGTRDGLSRYWNGHFSNILHTNGLPNDFIFNVLDDGEGNFWLSSDAGICRVSKAALDALADGRAHRAEFVSLSYRDGLRAASLVAGTQPNACVGGDGHLFFCSLNGLAVATPMNKTLNRQMPPVYIERVLINGQEDLTSRSPKLQPGPCEIEIHYTALSFIAPEKIRFKYRLDGFNTGWVDAGERRFAHYAGLPPGDYRFQVIACNNDGVWNTAGADYSFRLPPHYYQTSWFYLLIVLLITGLARGGYELKIRRVQAREEELQRRVDERTTELAKTNAALVGEIEQRTLAQKKSEELQEQLMDASRHAGQAEVASSVLHNVGNVLNSANVSTSLITDRLRRLRYNNLAEAAGMIEQSLASSQTSDERIGKLPGYLRQLGSYFGEERKGLLDELKGLAENIEHIKAIVALQQNYARVSGVLEKIAISELVDSVLRMYAQGYERDGIDVVREYEPVPEVLLDKHRLLQILINIVDNARNACNVSHQPTKRVVVRVNAHGADRIAISIADNGRGIAGEDLTRIFTHGFTTRKNGHGLGLHSSAVAAREMGGMLTVASAGIGCGATFILELPLDPPSKNGRN